MNANRAEARDEITRILCLDQNCSQEHLRSPGTIITGADELEGRRRFPFREHRLTLTTMGKGVVISCSPDRLDWVEENLGHQNRDTLFAASTLASLDEFVRSDDQRMAGPDLKFSCDGASFRPQAVPHGVSMELLEKEAIRRLYALDGFKNALGQGRDSQRPDVLAAVAERHGEVVGIAGVSADCDSLWQVGIDVVESHQGRGIGKALVAQVTSAILDTGRVPYYSTWPANIASRVLAATVGYWPAWVELCAR